MRKWLYICSVLWLLTACHDDALSILDMKSPGVDERFWESVVYTANQRCADTIYAHSEQYNVYVCTDSHLDTTTYNLRGFIKEYHADTLCPFAIHLGDYMRYKGGMGRIKEAYTDPTLHTSGKVDTAFFCLSPFAPSASHEATGFAVDVGIDKPPLYAVCVTSGKIMP